MTKQSKQLASAVRCRLCVVAVVVERVGDGGRRDV